MMCHNLNTNPPRNEHKLSFYGNKTYVGNWFEDRSRYRKTLYNHTSTYSREYIPKVSHPDPDQFSKNALQSAGIPRHMIFGQSETTYTNNFSSSYDLCYNHLVEKEKTNPTERHWICKERTWIPEKDLTKDYGNITRYGMYEYKNSLWEKEKGLSHEKDDVKSEYKETYECLPNIGPVKHIAIPRKNSSLMKPTNIFYKTLKLRDLPVSIVTSSDELVIIPRKHRDNPITWD